MADPEQVWYFAYGSNMDPGQMIDRRVRFREARKAVLRDYTLVFTRYSVGYNAGVAAVIPSPGTVVEGVLYAVNEQGLKALDKHEGVDRGLYKRVNVTVEAEGGQHYEAVCYQTLEKRETPIPPNGEYLAKLIRGAEAFNLSPQYVASLREKLLRARRERQAMSSSSQSEDDQN